MKNEIFLRAMGDIDDDLIRAARRLPQKNPFPGGA